MRNSRKMQRIRPRMNAIKERSKKYKTLNPKRNEMNVEIIKLQKDNGVTVFGGCIPQRVFGN
jgi:YidC/Oxa1 family membrane protein insertase